MQVPAGERKETPGRGRDPFLLLEEGNYILKTLTEPDERNQAYRLRHRIFCERLGWTPKKTTEMETDDYDAYAVPFGVFDERRRLNAYIRLIAPTDPFMLDREFSFLVGDWKRLRKDPGAGEISRLCLAREGRTAVVSGPWGVQPLSLFLFKGLYVWCLESGIRRLYAVTEHKTCRLFGARGIPVGPIGEPRLMPDGVVAIAVIVDWDKLGTSELSRSRQLLGWFNQGLLSRSEWRPRRPEPGTTHRASA
jgi:acyl homoserine lactone synthase